MTLRLPNPCRIAAAVTAASLVMQTMAATAAAADAPGGSTTQTVEQLADRAYQQQAAGQYADSIATYLKAYELSKASEILFNIATIYDRKLHERGLAEEFFRRYLAQTDVTPELAKRATARLTELKREQQAADDARKAAGVVAPVPPTPPPSPSAPSTPAPPVPAPPPQLLVRPDPTWRATGIIVAATGVAGVLASLALGAAAKAKNDAANAECSGASCGSQQGVTDARDAGNYATYSDVAVAVGGALVALGVTLYLVAPRTQVPPSAGTTLTLAPAAVNRGGGLGLSASF